MLISDAMFSGHPCSIVDVAEAGRRGPGAVRQAVLGVDRVLSTPHVARSGPDTARVVILRADMQTSWQRYTRFTLRNSCTRSMSACAIASSASGVVARGGLTVLIFFFTHSSTQRQ